MKLKKQLSISEFARLSGIKRDNLRYYDRIGLLSPETRGENNYRYYTPHQLNAAYLISDLRGLDVSIDDIRQISKRGAPEQILDLLSQQDIRIQAEIKQLNEKRKIMKMHTEILKEVLAHGEYCVYLKQCKSEEVFLCPPIPQHMSDDEGGVFSYEQAEALGVNINVPQGAIVRFVENNTRICSEPRTIYFKVIQGGNYIKPAGQYICIYGRGDLYQPGTSYEKLLEYAKENQLRIIGDAFEEYPMYDISGNNDMDYYKRLQVQVTKNT